MAVVNGRHDDGGVTDLGSTHHLYEFILLIHLATLRQFVLLFKPLPEVLVLQPILPGHLGSQEFFQKLLAVWRNKK